MRGGGIREGVAGWALAQLGRWPNGPASWVGWPGGVLAFLFLFFSFFCILFLFIFFNLFSLTVLIQLRAFKYLINLCFLYYNYLCDIRHNLNIFFWCLKIVDV